jgi:hypothetical protein
VAARATTSNYRVMPNTLSPIAEHAIESPTESISNAQAIGCLGPGTGEPL